VCPSTNSRPASGRAEKVALDLPADVRIENAGPGETISALLARGDIDAMIGPRAPLGFGSDPNIGWLHADTQAAATDWHRHNSVYPIMHLLGADPWPYGVAANRLSAPAVTDQVVARAVGRSARLA
jgi:hypothetical protein